MVITPSQAHLKAGDGQGCLLLVKELGQHEVARLHDGAEVHVQVGELVMLQCRALGSLRVGNPLVKVVIRVGEVLCQGISIRYAILQKEIYTPLKNMSAFQVNLLLGALHQKSIVVSQGLSCGELKTYTHQPRIG